MKSGFVAIVGRPNVGKSTLLNAILGKKISIVTNKSQTTRNNILGIYNNKDYQIVFTDTPGIHKPLAKLGEEMNDMAYNAASNVDALILVVDVSKPFGSGDEFLIKKLGKINCPFFIAFNKIDLARIDEAEKVKNEYILRYPKAKIFDVCGKDKFNIDTLLENIKEVIPDGPAYYPTDIDTDRDEVFFIKEVIREKVLNELSAEVPHSVAIYVNNVEWENNPMLIQVTLYVEKESQKGILIGANGRRIKAIGCKARTSIEARFHKQVYLELKVDIDEDWRNKEKSLKTYGFLNK